MKEILVLLVFLTSVTVMLTIPAAEAADSITTAQFIRENETIVSSGGSFELGFFRPGSSQNLYLGIWYKKITTRTVVWVANREAPLTNQSAILKVSRPGVLNLYNGTSSSIWSSNTSRHVENPIAQLLDSGNLVVKDANDDNPENFLWQSFDYPTDTLLPGMKLGKNLVTGRDWYLSSWKSSDDPGQGLFTYWLDNHGYPQFWGSNGSVFLYRSGPWNGQRFSGDPSLKKNSIYKFNFVVDKGEIYYSYDLLNSSVISRFLIRENGLVQRWTWVDGRGWVLYLSGPTDACDYYAVCGAYGRCNVNQSPICGCLEKFVPKFPDEWAMGVAANGCVRKTPLNCSNGDGFLKYTGVKLPDTQRSWFNESMNLKECHTVCLRNCSCMAYATLNISGEGSGCLLWFNDLIDTRQFTENGQIIYVRVASSELDASEGKKGKTIAISLAVSMGTLTLILCLIFYVWKRKMKQQQKRNANSGIMGDISRQGYRDESQRKDLELPLFDLFTITSATNNFSHSNKLGEGGFGSVYKGILEEGQEIAVKRLSSSSTQGLDEFKNEVICIAKLQHRNLVKLLGCCIQGEEKMLIYEYMPNKSLDSFIFDKSRSAILDWLKRFHIISGIARGLLYLHQDSRLRIIHRDLKASNVLLDSYMNPKISDFGMARSFGGDETEANTRRVVGTYGYMSPEYTVDGLFSVKSDVFSFGVLVLEIVSGKRNRGFSDPDHSLNLLGHAWMLCKEGRLLEMLDEAVKRESCHLSEVLRSLHVGLLCVQQHPEDRPTMATVVLMLGSAGPLPSPKQPGFFTARNLAEADSSSGNRATSSTNDLTITVLEPR